MESETQGFRDSGIQRPRDSATQGRIMDSGSQTVSATRALPRAPGRIRSCSAESEPAVSFFASFSSLSKSSICRDASCVVKFFLQCAAKLVSTTQLFQNSFYVLNMPSFACASCIGFTGTVLSVHSLTFGSKQVFQQKSY